MRILVTRPEREARHTAVRLAALGHQVSCAPLIDIVATGATLTARQYDALLATSAQAIALLKEDETRTIRDRPLFVVGERTAGAARDKGFADVRPPAPDARRLAEMIAASYAGAAKFLYLAGRDRKSDLETVLIARGHKIEVAIVYEARAAAALPQAAIDALCAGDIHAVLHYSARSAAIFRDLAETAGLTEPARRPLHVCISEDVAAALQGWATRIAVADAPNEAAMVAALDVMNDR